ncbi:hypothetical protein BH24ACT23_BH24ACT23_05100 [soil metagenome]
MRSVFARLGAWCVERPAPVIAMALLLAILGVVGAGTLKPNGEADTLVDKGSETFKATERFKEKFGDDAVVILVQGDLEQLVLTKDLGKLLLLESCLAGTAPADQLTERIPTPEVCNRLAETNPSRVVFGPATFLNQFAQQASALFQQQTVEAQEQARQAAAAAEKRALREGASQAEAETVGQNAAAGILQAFQSEIARLATRYGQIGLPSIDSPTFVRPVVFDSRFTDGTPKAKFSYLFPSKNSALISVRLRPDLTEAERSEAIDLIRGAVAEDVFSIRNTEYVVSGVPVVVDGLTDELEGEIVVLLVAALVVMALVLALIFAPPLRLLPLGIGLVASAMSFGALALFGGTLTMASIAGLPVLIGLAVDYAIQLHARFAEARAGGSSPARAAAEATAAGGPVIATAGLATAAGFLVLVLSPIPMVRSFGLLLMGGILIAFAVALTAGLALLSLTPASAGSGRASGLAQRLRARTSAVRREPPPWLSRFRAGMRKLGPRSLAASIAIPGRVILAAAVLSVAGWVAGTRTEIVSDFRELVPASLPELQDVDRLQDETGVSGQVDVTITADDITDPAVVEWMRDYRQRVLDLGGFTGEFPSCRDEATQVCPAISLPDLFGDGVPDQDRIRSVLSLLPPYFAQAVIETDTSTGQIGNTALLSFGIKVMPFDEQKDLIDAMRAEVNPPGVDAVPVPDGVDVEVVGLPVLVADANAALGSNRYILTLVSLIAVGLVLLAVKLGPLGWRRYVRGGKIADGEAGKATRRALIPLVPVILAPGWSALVLEGAGLSLNPMSATLGALVIAIATEFSVLLSSRYYEERDRGLSVGEALRLTYTRTGAAVIASGVTTIAGFAVLALAAPVQALFGGDAIRMLTEFGVVGVIDLLIALAGVLLVLPAVLVWAEGDFAGVRAAIGRLRTRSAEATAVH